MAKQLILTAVLEDLKNGMSRRDINAKYELNPIDIKKLWSHEKLKNKRPAKYVSELELIDDITVDYGDKVPSYTNPITNVQGQGTAPSMSGTF